MSQHFSLSQVFRDMYLKHDVPQSKVAAIACEVIESIEWDFNDFVGQPDASDENWDINKDIATMEKYLFG